MSNAQHKIDPATLRQKIGEIIGLKGEITAADLQDKLKPDYQSTPAAFLAPGPKGQPQHLLSSWITLFAKDPQLAYMAMPAAFDFIDWGTASKKGEIQELFTSTKNTLTSRGDLTQNPAPEDQAPEGQTPEATAPEDQAPARPMPEDQAAERQKPNNQISAGESFIRVLDYVIHLSKIPDNEVAAILHIDKTTLSAYMNEKVPLTPAKIEAMLAHLEEDFRGPKKISAYGEFRDRLRSFASPDPAEDCGFGELLAHVILKSRLPHGRAAQLLELSSKSLTYILRHGAPRIRMQRIVSVLDTDLEGKKIFSAYGAYQTRFKAFLPVAETFEALVGYVIAESSILIAEAASILGVSTEGLKRNIRGSESMKPLTKQKIYDGLEADHENNQYFKAYGKYRDRIRALKEHDMGVNAFHLLLGQIIMESHRSRASSAGLLGVERAIFQAYLRGDNAITRETAERIIAALEEDLASSGNFPAYANHRERLEELASNLRTDSEIRSEAYKKRNPERSVKKDSLN